MRVLLEQLSMSMYSHLIAIEEESRELLIYRQDVSGKTTLYTRIQLPESNGWDEGLTEFAKALGENILLDSPQARRLLGI